MSILLGAALAAAMASGQDYAQQRVAPRGGYTQSCSEAYVNRGRLYADCRDTRGRMRGTSIELNRCGGEEGAVAPHAAAAPVGAPGGVSRIFQRATEPAAASTCSIPAKE